MGSLVIYSKLSLPVKRIIKKKKIVNKNFGVERKDQDVYGSSFVFMNLQITGYEFQENISFPLYKML